MTPEVRINLVISAKRVTLKIPARLSRSVVSKTDVRMDILTVLSEATDRYLSAQTFLPEFTELHLISGCYV